LKELNEQIERNECPIETAESKNHKPVSDMSMTEFNQYMAASSKYSEESFDWIKKSIAFCMEKISINNEIFESVVELYNFAEEEKWLLLSIALIPRRQDLCRL
jgi:hypothetical protein